MSLNNILNQFLGSSSATPDSGNTSSTGVGQSVSNLVSGIPGGLAGGAAAGGIMALLMSNKSARKYAGKAAKLGGAAVLGGLAFKAFQNWRDNNPTGQVAPAMPSAPTDEANFHQQAIGHSPQGQEVFELTMVKAMIAAAKADGHIDSQEQKRIFDAVDKLDLSAEHKATVFDCLRKDITVQELTQNMHSTEMKAEIYLASCLVIDPDHPAERAHLDDLGQALNLPQELLQQLEWQAQQAYADAA